MVKNDDGEAGAGMIILRMLEREGLGDHIDVVTVWFGGKHLGCGRFRHVQEAISPYNSSFLGFCRARRGFLMMLFGLFDARSCFFLSSSRPEFGVKVFAG